MMKLILYIFLYTVFCICCIFFTGAIFAIGCCIGIGIIISITTGNFKITRSDEPCEYCKGTGEVEVIGFHNDTVKMKCKCQEHKN